MPISYTYQWKRVDPNTGTSTNITGATGTSYVVQSTDLGYKIKCTVTANNGVASASADSNQTTAITNPNTFAHRVKRWHKAVGAVVAAVILAGTGTIVYNTVTPSSGGGGSLGGVTVANLWFTKPGDTPGSCTRSATAVAYNAATSCGAAQYLNQAVSAASIGDTIGVPGGTYPPGNGGSSPGKQTLNYESRLQNLSPGCDPLGTWGAVNKTNCIRIAPQQGQQATFMDGWEMHTGAIWIDGSATGSVTNKDSRQYSFTNYGLIDTESDDNTNFSGTGIPSTHYPDHVTITGWNVYGNVVTYGSNYVRVSQTSMGNYVHNETPTTGCTNYQAYANDANQTVFNFNATGANESAVGGRNGIDDTNILWDHNYIHDINNVSDPSCDPHDGGLFIHNGVNGFTLDSNIWEQVWVYDIQLQQQGGYSGAAPATNITMQNNWFGVGVKNIRPTGGGANGNITPGQRGLQFDGGLAWTNFLIRYNSFDQQGSSLCATGTDCLYSNVRFIGNTGAIPASGTAQPCGAAGVSFDKNVWNNGTCGSGDIASATDPFVNSNIGSEDFHLASTSSPPNNLVPATNSDYTLGTDIDGQTRPIGANRDAGADEQ